MTGVSLQSATPVKPCAAWRWRCPAKPDILPRGDNPSEVNAIFLGVSIDHVAVLRQAGASSFPDPLYAALLAEQAGADFITMHLRQDRRHIQDRDVEVIRYGLLRAGMNLQVVPTKAMLEIVSSVQPAQCCFVAEPSRANEASAVVNVVAQRSLLADACQQLRESSIAVALAIAAEAEQIDAAAQIGALGVQLDTSAYAKARGISTRGRALQRIAAAAQHAADLGLTVAAGGGLSYQNVLLLAGIRRIETLQVGHAIVARAVLDGMVTAVTEMQRLMASARED